MQEYVTISLNGREVQASQGATVFEAALDNDVYIPHLCHHPDLAPAGVCRLCMVEVEGRPGTPLSCLTKVEDGMAVRTETDAVNKIRRVALELLIADHRGDCLSCVRNDDCQLQRAAAHVGIGPDRLDRLRRTTEMLPVDDSNPFFTLDPNKCVLCGICVRTCNELQGIAAIDFMGRGYETVVGTFDHGPIAESRCVSCGECVVRCPVGALSLKRAGKPSHWVKTVCPYCGVGCGIELGVRDDRIVGTRGVADSPVNGGSLCVKGRFGQGFVNSPDRLTTPLIKRDGEFVEATWDEALDLVAERFSQHKGKESAVLASAKCTIEENYVVQKFARVALATHTIDHCARL